MGLRGVHSTATTPRNEPTLDITPEAIVIYKKMRKLEQSCNCATEECEHWEAYWEMNEELTRALGLPAWEFAYTDPAWRDKRTRQSEIDRFHALEAAAAAVAPKPKKRGFKYKWQQ